MKLRKSQIFEDKPLTAKLYGWNLTPWEYNGTLLCSDMCTSLIYFQVDYSTTTINYCAVLQLLNLRDNLFVIQKFYVLDAFF
jgi:hypothetical protein